VNATEMAAVLPGIFLVFDWIYVSPPSGTIGERVRWMMRHCHLAAALAVISVGATIGKSVSTGPFATPDYAMSFTMQRFFQNAKLIYSELFYLKFMQLNSRRVILLWIFLFALAVW